MKTLLIWNNFEDINCYLIPDAPEWISSVHRRYIGVDDDEKLLLRVSDAICPKLEWFGDPDDELAGQWVKYQIDSSVPMKIHDATVVITGSIP